MTRRKPPQISPVTKVAENVQIFASPKARATILPEITGEVTVSFKHEDSHHGMALGPVTIIDRTLYETWLKEHGVAHTNGRGEVRHLVPFGAKPQGRHDLGWVTKHQALEVAAHYGVELKEF